MRRRLDETGSALPPSLVPLPPVDQPHKRRFPFRRLLGEQLLVRESGERDDAKPLALPCQHLERRPADRPGRAEDRDPDAHRIPNMRYNPAAVGITKYTKSSRSGTPPRPGMRVEEALRPA